MPQPFFVQQFGVVVSPCLVRYSVTTKGNIQISEALLSVTASFWELCLTASSCPSPSGLWSVFPCSLPTSLWVPISDCSMETASSRKGGAHRLVSFSQGWPSYTAYCSMSPKSSFICFVQFSSCFLQVVRSSPCYGPTGPLFPSCENSLDIIFTSLSSYTHCIRHWGAF